MEDRKSVSKSVLATTISALAVVATLAGSGVAWLMSQQDNQPAATRTSAVVSADTNTKTNQVSPPTAAPLPATTNPPVGSPTTQQTVPALTQTNPKSTSSNIAQNGDNVKIWRLDDDGKKTFLVPQERQAPQDNSAPDPDAAVKRPLANLIASAGKTDDKLTSTIPVGTKLLSAKVKPDGIHVNLSKEFIQSGGSTSAVGRLGQVIYTATAQNPNAPVWISVEGKPLEVLGDAGVEVRQPITRKMYDEDFPINPK